MLFIQQSFHTAACRALCQAYRSLRFCGEIDDARRPGRREIFDADVSSALEMNVPRYTDVSDASRDNGGLPFPVAGRE